MSIMKTPNGTSLDKTRLELRNFIYRKVRDKDLAEDIVQEVFIKIHMRLGQLRDEEKITGWLYQIARNAIIDHYRSRSKSLHPADLNWESDRQLLNECVSSCLGEMLVTLPQKYREALELAEIGNLSQTELAERLQLSYSGAKSRVQRARKMLRQKMDEAYIIKTDSYGNVTVCKDRVPCNL
jgi:RNA polymerase sigma-70 factor (ECF subfamily)